jgi:LPXTG-site transpeptidase (sortase) family protein
MSIKFQMAGRLCILAGLYLLLFVGGLYAEASYNRLAARGDSNLPLVEPKNTRPPPPTPPASASAAALAREGEARGHITFTTAPPLSEPQSLSIAAFDVPAFNPFHPHDRAPVAPAAPAATGTQARPQTKSPAEEQDSTEFVSTITRLIIPAIGVDTKVIEVGWTVEQQENGESVSVWDVARYAVGHHHGSANPGEGDNIVLSGHVGGYGRVFKDLFSIEPGDHLTLYSNGNPYRYVVQEQLLVDEENVSEEQRYANARYIAPGNKEIVTLVTCWPPTGDAKFNQRIIVRAIPARATLTAAWHAAQEAWAR